MRGKQLGPRLEAALSLFPRVSVGADIGADHGYLSLALLQRGLCARLWAADISAPSLAKAERLLARHGLSSRALFGVGDGFMPIGEPVEAAAILGMGGVTIRNILRSQQGLLRGCRLVLSANTEMPSVRRTLMEIGYRIEREAVAEEDGRFYPMLLASPGRAAYTEKELLLGPCLTRSRPDDTYRRYLAKKQADQLAEQGPPAVERRQWIMEESERVQADRPHDRGLH